MENNINELLLHTAFACMACDGDIAQEEINLIKELDEKEHLFGEIEINDKLKLLTDQINEQGLSFLKRYINLINETELNEEESIKVLDVAAKTIKADKQILYSEIKFFKVIKANLNVSDETILDKVEGIDDMWVAQDIKDYSMLYDSYFDNIELPKFNLKALSLQEKQEEKKN